MWLHPAGNIQLRVPHRPVDLQKCWLFPYMRLLWWLHRRRWDQLCAAGTPHTKHHSSLSEGGVFMYRVGIFTCPNTGVLRINLSRQVKPPKKFRQWHRTYWQGLSKIWRAGFDPVWTQILATSSTCHGFLHNEVSRLQISLQYPH